MSLKLTAQKIVTEDGWFTEKLIDLVRKHGGCDAPALKGKGFRPNVHGSLRAAEKAGRLAYVNGAWTVLDVEVKVEKKHELYDGKPTGRIVFHVSTTPNCKLPLNLTLGAVLGRDYCTLDAMEDFVRRARGDGHRVTMAQVILVEKWDWTDGGKPTVEKCRL